MNRKLIRPSLAEVKEKMTKDSAPRKKAPPPFETHAENYYYLKQMNKKTPMAVVLIDGEEVRGYIEWYDRYCLKLNRDDAPNLLLFKNSIKYMYKLNDNKHGSQGQGARKK
jgi:host factor-I protein